MRRVGFERSKRKDLTRWNRSGLTRLEYVDANAADHLETIRSILARGFPFQWQAQLEPPFDPNSFSPSDSDTDYEWARHAANQHLIEQYVGDRGDIGWELARAFARSCHVLSRHINAHANGAFLRTAGEWDDVRKMVAMLGYRPVGATSATTMLAIDARAKGRVGKGLQVRHRPPDGGKTIIFETLEDVDVDPDVNLLQVPGRNQSRTPLLEAENTSAADPASSPWQQNPKAHIANGDSTLIVRDRTASDAEAAWVVAKHESRLVLVHEGNKWKAWTLGQARLMSSPRFRRMPWINGETVRRTSVPHGMSPGTVLAWRKVGEENPAKWRFAEVRRSDAFGLELVDKVRAFDRYEKDEEWPSWGSGDIEIRRAAKLTGSFTVPPGSEAEKKIGKLAPFTAAQFLGDPPNMSSVPSSTDSIKFDTAATNAELSAFIQWLFQVTNIAASFPLTPAILVKMGAMMLVKDARIPSTGQLVFEAFLDLLGGGGGPTSGDPPQALFRFWLEDDGGQTSTTSGPTRADLTANGELWYIPVEFPGLGDIDATAGKPEILVSRNDDDDGWFFFDGKPAGLNVGDWAAARFAHPADDDVWRAVRIVAIESPLQSQDVGTADPVNPAKRYEQPSAFGVRLALPPASGISPGSAMPELVELQADYRANELPVGATVNTEPISNPIELEPCPGPELVGLQLIAVNDAGETQVVRVTAVEDCKVTLSPNLSPEFTEGNLKLFGNLVRAGHGKRQPPLRTGGGTGSRRKNFLVLERQDVSTVPDARMLHGAREDIEVRIADAQWQLVPRFDDSKPADRHYVVTSTEEGFLRIEFGDGKFGRALPPGTDNVEIHYRVGAGTRGSVPARSLEQLVTPHPLINAVMQPSDAVDGADMELPEHMRDRAPASLLALERAVSLRDFEQLAMQHRSILHARAVYAIGARGRSDEVIVVAVPTSGQTLDPETQRDLVGYLERRAVPTVRVRAVPHEPIDVHVSIQIRVDHDTYEPHAVAAAVRNRIAERFSAVHRAIGQPLRLSELYAVVEEVRGVEDSVCEITKPASGADAVVVAERQIASIPDLSAVSCAYSEYVP